MLEAIRRVHTRVDLGQRGHYIRKYERILQVKTNRNLPFRVGRSLVGKHSAQWSKLRKRRVQLLNMKMNTERLTCV